MRHAAGVTEENIPAFDLIGARYDESFVERDAQLAEGAWLIDQLSGSGRVLDLGCGSGLPSAKQFVDAGLDVVGVDESAKMLDLAREHAPGAELVHGDLRAVDELGEFDAVVAFFALLMLPRADIAPLLSRVRARLRGQKLLLVSMVIGDFDEFPISFLGAATKVTAYPPDELAEVVASAGFEVLSSREVEVQAEPGRVEAQIYLRARALD